jgi:tetratricopeptide (TPR) repeat protein
VYAPPVESRDKPPAEKQSAEAAEAEKTEPAVQTRGIEDAPEAIEETAPAPAMPFRSKPAVLALLGSARAAQHDGDLQKAQTDLQRAQRIAPRDPNIYFELADTHYQMQEYPLAEQVALKGVSVAGQDRNLVRQFWLLISEIRYASGNSAGGQQAEQQANQY